MTITGATSMVDAPARPHRTTRAWPAQVVRWATVVLFLALWEFLLDGPFAGNNFIAAPSGVVSRGLPVIFEPANLNALWQTTSRFLQAFAIVAVFGTAIGLVLGRIHRQVFHGARDVVTVLYALPMVPFYPLFVLWLGLGMRSEVAFGVIHGIIPVILITMTASAGVDPNLVTSGDSMGASALQRLRLIILPAILPDVFSALKIGAALSLLGVLLGELMISIDGIGTFISGQINNHGAAPLDAMIIVVCVGVVVINVILSAIERRVSKWRA